MEDWQLPAWSLPLVVVALVVPAFVGFALGGAALGSALGAATVATLIVLAARTRAVPPISLAAPDRAAPLIAVALAPIEDARTANELATLAEAGGGEGLPTGGDYAILVLAPALPTRAQRWLSDEEPGRLAAQERLAVSIATLTAAGTHAEGRVVSESPAQALEDVAAEHRASRVAFVVSGPGDDALVAQLTERLDVPANTIVAA